MIARVLSESEDHPDVELLHQRASEIDPRISIATVYRTVRLFEEAGILDRHDFGDGRARYEAAPEAHHDHLIDVESGSTRRGSARRGWAGYRPCSTSRSSTRRVMPRASRWR
ncbi:transcriptional repressor [Leptolyngbya sp. 15MV]|nr:transcriptional repressor [Leptolyngbya sp. 15MV]